MLMSLLDVLSLSQFSPSICNLLSLQMSCLYILLLEKEISAYNFSELVS